jgi:Carboxypeptidase regulatory-like domain
VFYESKSPQRIPASLPILGLRLGLARSVAACLFVLLSVLPALAQSPQSSESEQPTAPLVPGRINGTIIDQAGTPVFGAQAKLARPDQSSTQEFQTDEDGNFYFTNVPPGDFQITITVQGFAPKSVSGTLHSGESYTVPQITLAIATEVTEVRVTVSPVEVAEMEIKEQEKQRVFGLIPNFYVSYDPNPAPLNARQKMHLAWRSSLDPLTLAGVGFVAGIEQAQNAFSGYGQGAQGYGKRYGAALADVSVSTFLGSAILPSVLKQDPRYFYQGTGSGRSRLWHAVKSSFMCRSDNKHWGPNYSNVGGALATGAISNLYYPANQRGVGLVLGTAAIRIGESAGANIFQEFILRKLTPGLSHRPQQN